MEKAHLKIFVAHPGKQHSYRMAGALEKTGYLSCYITTVYNSKASFLMRVVKHVIGQQDRKRAENRNTVLIPSEKIKQFCEIRGLFVLAILRLDKKRHVYDWYNRHVSKVFGRKVAIYALKNHVDAVICYDAAAEYCFKILKEKAPNIIRILDNAAVNRYGLCKIYQELDQKYGILKDPTGFKSYLLNERDALPYQQEAFLADYHMVASSFSKQVLLNIGVEDERIAVIPYGVEIDKIPHKEKYDVEGKLKILYVGEVSPQKGIYDFLEMTERFRDNVEFHIVGSGLEKLSQKNQERIRTKTEFHGYMLQEDLFQLYSDCDLFLFPSLGDGFGFVVIEAMAAGLPVICSSNSIGYDAVQDGKNGFVYQTGNVDELEEKIEYFLENRLEIERMGREAIVTTQRYTWDNYDSLVKSVIDRMVEKI